MHNCELTRGEVRDSGDRGRRSLHIKKIEETMKNSDLKTELDFGLNTGLRSVGAGARGLSCASAADRGRPTAAKGRGVDER
jgi:hypothetical protein